MKPLYIISIIYVCLDIASSISSDSPGLTYIEGHLDKYCEISSSQYKECSNDRKDSRLFASKQGKAGPRGPPGPPGKIVDEDLERRIEQKLAGRCQVIYNEKCFWFIDSMVDYMNANRLCNDQGGHPANIYSLLHYNMILKHVRGLRDGVTEPWLGMTYDTQESRLKLYNGTSSEFKIPWHPGYPSKSPAKYRLLLSIRSEWKDARQGIWSSSPTSIEEGVVCEI